MTIMPNESATAEWFTIPISPSHPGDMCQYQAFRGLVGFNLDTPVMRRLNTLKRRFSSGDYCHNSFLYGKASGPKNVYNL